MDFRMMFSHLERFEHPWLRGQIRPEFDPDRFNVEHTMGEADRLMELQRGLMPAFFENNTFILIDAICPGLRRLVRAFGVPVATAHFNPESLCYHSIRLTIHWPDNPYVKAAEVNDRKDEQLANWLGEPLSHLAQLREPALKLLILASDFPKFAEALRFLLNLSTFDCYYICDDSVNYVCWKRAALPTGTREPDRWERFSRYPNTLYEKSYPFPHVEISSFEVVGPQWCQQLKQISRVEKNRFLRTLQGMTGLGYSLHWHGDWTDQDIEKVSAVTAPACIWASVQDTCRFFSMRKLKIFADAILVEQQNWVEALSTYSLIGAIPFGCPVFRRFQHWPFTEEPSGMLAKTCTWNLLRDCEVMLQRLCSKAYNPRIQEIEVRPECCPFRLTMDLKPPTAYGIGGETSLRREPHIWSVALDHIKLLHKFNHISSRHEEATPAGHLRFLEFFHEVRRLRTYNAAYRGLVYPEYEDDYNHLSFFVDRHQGPLNAELRAAAIKLREQSLSIGPLFTQRDTFTHDGVITCENAAYHALNVSNGWVRLDIFERISVDDKSEIARFQERDGMPVAIWSMEWAKFLDNIFVNLPREIDGTGLMVPCDHIGAPVTCR